MSFVVGVDFLKPELVLLATARMSVTRATPDNGEKHIKAMGYILVQ